jgi:tRNA modification GTPase
VQSTEIIAAIATPAGRGGIGIVRVSGKNIAGFSQVIGGGFPAPRVATHTDFIAADGAVIDSGLALYFPAPASYTGEDVLELQGHGGPVIMQMLLRRCLELGARVANPGEFTLRAYLNDKLDLAQAEGVADIIDAASETAARCALRSLKGEFSAAINAIERDLLVLRTYVEATLDFPEEEIEDADQREILSRLSQLDERLAHVLIRSSQGSILRNGLSVVIAGRPNVGKSSLMNRLAREEVAIVTSAPGTTRDAIRQSVQVRGIPINVIDTAGLRESSDEVEAIGMQRTWDSIGRADVVLHVVDATMGVTEADQEILARLPVSLKRVTVFNKMDLVPVMPLGAEAGKLSVWVSAKTGAGIDELEELLVTISGWHSTGEDVFLGRERHLVALRFAKESISRAAGQSSQPELLAEELRMAHWHLGSIAGHVSADDLLGEIFSSFCIGK